MATCPYCKGFLSDNHRCPRRRSVVITEVIVTAIAGGLAGLLMLAAFDPRGQVTDLDTLAFVIGAGAAVIINRTLRSL